MAVCVSGIKRASAGLLMVGVLMLGGNAAFAADCNVEKGAQVATKCVACHAIEVSENKVGPSLVGIVGRKAARYPDFKYSRALRNLDVVWTADALDHFLAAPQKFAKGTTMAFAGLRKDDERADLICYLQSLNHSE